MSNHTFKPGDRVRVGDRFGTLGSGERMGEVIVVYPNDRDAEWTPIEAIRLASQPRPSEFAARHITGEGVRTIALYRLFFREALQHQLKIRADYDAEVEDWYTNGDGRPVNYVVAVLCLACGQHLGDDEDIDYSVASKCDETDDGKHSLTFRRYNAGGNGWTFPHCIHGSSRWTDYDNICGGCEDDSTAIEDAIVYGRERYLRFVARWDWLQSAPGDFASQRPEEFKSIQDWVLSIFPGHQQ